MTCCVFSVRCPTNRRQVSVVESGLSSRARFSALFFSPQGEYQNMYLHCSLSLCHRRSYSCVPVSHTFDFIRSTGNCCCCNIGFNVVFSFLLSFFFLKTFSSQICRSRRYRSVSSSTPLEPVSIGPITCEYKIQSGLRISLSKYWSIQYNLITMSLLSFIFRGQVSWVSW